MKKEPAILACAVLALCGAHGHLSWHEPAASPAISSRGADTKPKGRLATPSRVEAKVGGDVAPDGVPVQVDLPQDLRLHNTGGRDGAGLCVFTSINHAALWQAIEPLLDFQKWMKAKPGGGYPEKVAAMITQKCKELAVPEPKYVQVEGSDLEPIRVALKTGRMPCITYSFSPSGRYGGRRIAHMVNCVHDVNGYFGILDNNYPDALEWLNETELKKSYGGAGGGWTIIFLEPGPPPPPHNKK
jgi:hypothetical protein